MLPGLALLQLVLQMFGSLSQSLAGFKVLLISRHLNIIVISTSRERNLSDSL